MGDEINEATINDIIETLSIGTGNQPAEEGTGNDLGNESETGTDDGEVKGTDETGDDVEGGDDEGVEDGEGEGEGEGSEEGDSGNVEDGGSDDEDGEEELSLEEQNALLLKRIEELTDIGERAPAKGDEAGGKEQEGDGKESAAPAIPNANKQAFTIKSGVVDFVGDGDVDEIVDNKDKLNLLLNTVYAAAIEQANKSAYERMLTSIPEIITGHINRNAIVSNMVKEFYDNNPDLVSVKRTVGAIANDIHAQDPGKTLEEVFDAAAKQTRKVLGLKIPKTKAEKSKNLDNPGFVGKRSGGRVIKKTKQTTQDEIADLFGL